MSGPIVIGSRSTPASWRLTFRTSAACWRGDRFLWRMPSPPSCARAIARRESVTVSIAADTNGQFQLDPAGNREERSVSRGNTAV